MIIGCGPNEKLSCRGNWQSCVIVSVSCCCVNKHNPRGFQFSLVQPLSHVRSLQPHELQHARHPYPSPTPGVYPNSCPSSQWCHPAISSSVIPFSSCPQSLPGSGSFPMSQLFAWDGNSIGVSASTSVLLKITQDWSPFRMDWLDLLAVQGTLKSLLQHYSSKASILRRSAFFIIQLSKWHKFIIVKRSEVQTVSLD